MAIVSVTSLYWKIVFWLIHQVGYLLSAYQKQETTKYVNYVVALGP